VVVVLSVQFPSSMDFNVSGPEVSLTVFVLVF